jgi:hypothetical protein
VKRGADGHVHYRALISARLDRALPDGAESELILHLAGCSRCRAVERDYRAQRARLAALPAVPPPRDLWARTSAALDVEMARSPRAARQAKRRDRVGSTGGSSRLLALSAASSLALAIVVIATQLNTGVTLPPSPDSPRAVPTPFDVPPEPVVFANFSADGVTVYQTEIAQVCPTPMVECSAADGDTRPVLRITGGGGRSGLAVHSDRGRLALLAVNDVGQETISVVTLPAVGTGSSAASEPGGPAVGSARMGELGPTRRPSAAPGTAKPANAVSPTAGQSSATPAIARPTRAPVTAAPATRSTGTTPPARQTSGPVGASDVPDGSMATTPVAILDRVRTAGAPAAWSPDGDTLAFSAMPADRSTGPDVYTWRAGETKAVRLTTDHASWFASWAGSRIVVSRVIQGPKRRNTATGTFVLDPATGESRPVPVSRMWLPAVDPHSRWAVSWLGTLAVAGETVVPKVGALYLIDWHSVDPFADHKAIVPAVVPPNPDADGPSRHLRAPAPNSTPRGSDKPRGALPPAKGNGPAPSTQPLETATIPGTVSPSPVEPGRDEITDPVLDWQVRWSDGGGTFGYWIADAPGGNWGRLGVLRLLPGTGGIDLETRPLDPTLSRRSFSLGSDRVAWVGPSDDQPAGELRLRTWDVHGYGGLRIRDLNVDGGVPAF